MIQRHGVLQERRTLIACRVRNGVIGADQFQGMEKPYAPAFTSVVAASQSAYAFQPDLGVSGMTGSAAHV